MFGDDLVYSNRVVQWTEGQIELFVRLENAPSSETVSALHAASVCVQASLNHCSTLESQAGLKLSKVPLVLLQPYVEEVLESDFRRARKLVFDFSGNDEILPVSPCLASLLSTCAITSDGLLVDRGTRLIFMVKEIVESSAAKQIKWAGVKDHHEDEDELFDESERSEVPLRRSAPQCAAVRGQVPKSGESRTLGYLPKFVCYRDCVGDLKSFFDYQIYHNLLLNMDVLWRHRF